MRGLFLNVAALAAFTVPAHAFVTLVTTPSGQPLAGEGVVTARTGVIEERFNSPSSPSTCAPPGGLGIDLVGVQGVTYDLANDSVTNLRKAPTDDTSCYLTVGSARGTESLEIDFAGASGTSPLTYFGLYWGSIDPYNHIAFFNANGAVDFAGGLGQQLDGSTVASQMGALQFSSNYVEFNTDASDQVTYAILSTDDYAFELDNIAYALAPTANVVTTPEPLAVGLLAFDVLALPLAPRRRS